MSEQIVDQSLTGGLNKGQRRKVRLGVALLLSLLLGALAALNYLAPKVPTHARGVTARIAWYHHSGQMRSDVRTAAAAFRFIMGTESDTPSLNAYANPPVAENAAPRSPKS